MYKINNSLRSTLLLGAATAAAVCLSTAAYADGGTVETVIVTGSRIPQQGLYSVSPVSAVSSQDLKLQGTTSVETMLNSMPQVYVGQNSTVNNGGNGEATVDLRGLGPSRTLVLVNGTRLMPGDPQDPVANLNDIPAALVDHIELLTGGASATYGSDALGGVVNFIMKKDFEGVQFDTQYGFADADNSNALLRSVVSAKGYALAPENRIDGQNADGTLTIGASTANGKGNVTAYVGFHEQKAVYWSARDYSACTLAASGTKSYSCGGSSNYNRFISIDNATASVSPYDFFETGTGVKGTGVFSPYASQTYNYGAQNYLQRPDTRYTGGFFAHYDVDSHIGFYSSFMFTDDHTVEVAAPSAVFLGTGTISGAFQQINCTNPLMTAQENQELCGLLPGDNKVSSGAIATALGHAYYDGAGNLTPGQALLEIGRRNIEGGNRVTELNHESYRIQIGAKGEIDNTWSYDVYAQFGTSRYTETLENELSKAKVQNALEVDPITGKCMTDSGSCVPLDIFNGFGSITSAMLAYSGTKGMMNGYTQEQIISGSVTGDLGEWGGKSPWAKDPIAVSFGSEYRAEALELLTDSEYQSNDLYGAGGATLSQPLAGFHVTEGFMEFRAPIIQDVPYVENLTIDGGYRFADYSSAGDATSYKAGVEYQPIDDFKVRGSIQRAVRAPSVLDLYTPDNNVLFSGDDPCATSTAGMCASVPHAGQSLLTCPASQCNYLTGGNTALKPEESDTKSFGVVFTPSFLPGFSATIDYWNIKVTKYINNISPGFTLDECYGSGATAATEAVYCPLVHRNAIGQIYGNGYVSALTQNTGFLKTDGIDFNWTYLAELEDLGLPSVGSLAFNFTGVYVNSYIAQTATGTTPYDCVGYYGPTCGTPDVMWRHKLRTTWETPWDLTLSLDWRYIGAVDIDENSPEIGTVGSYTAIDKHIRAYNYFDLTAVYGITKNVDVRAGVNNIIGQDPPALSSANTPLPTGNGNTFPGLYDYLGRTVFLSVTAKL